MLIENMPLRRPGIPAISAIIAMIAVVALSASYVFIRPSDTPVTSVAVIAPTVTATSLPIRAIPIYQIPPQLQSASAYFYDPNVSDGFSFGFKADEQRPMASTTKIMTAVVALLIATNYATPITVTSDVLQIDKQASVMGCRPGETLTLTELLYGLLLPSGDDAAVAIADGLAGSQANFVTKMNDTAAWLHLTNTHFVNVHGLDADGHYSSARDLAHLAEFAMSIPLFRQIVGTDTETIARTSQHGTFKLTNTNEFLDASTQAGKLNATLGIDGIKTGFTGNAEYCFVVHARRNGHEVYGVILGEQVLYDRFIDSAAMLTWAYTQIPGA